MSSKVGIDSLKLRLEMATKRREEDIEVQNRKNTDANGHKWKFNKIIEKLTDDNLPLANLLTAQLKILCDYKKI